MKNIALKTFGLTIITILSTLAMSSSSLANYNSCKIAKNRLKEAITQRQYVSNAIHYHSVRIHEIGRMIDDLLREQSNVLRLRSTTNYAVQNYFSAVAKRIALKKQISDLLIQIERAPASESISTELSRLSSLENQLAQVERNIYSYRHNLRNAFAWYQVGSLLRLAIINTNLFVQNGFQAYHRSMITSLGNKYVVKNAAVQVALADKNKACRYYE